MKIEEEPAGLGPGHLTPPPLMLQAQGPLVCDPRAHITPADASSPLPKPGSQWEAWGQ